MTSSSPPAPTVSDWRQYQAIWEALKAKGECSVAAHTALHPRIIKAVIKEKYNDLGWKILMEDRQIPWNKISYSRENSLIRFRLRKGIGLGTL